MIDDVWRQSEWYGFNKPDDLRIGRRWLDAVERGEPGPVGMLDSIRMCAYRERRDNEIERMRRWCEAVVAYADEQDQILRGLSDGDECEDEGRRVDSAGGRSKADDGPAVELRAGCDAG